jgi:Uma2 family endonuclease
MSTAPDRRRVSFQEYLAWEERSEKKHEYYRGEIFAMAGATFAHNQIFSNLFGAFKRLLEGTPCEAYGSDLRVRINAVDLSTYPDISIVCGGAKQDEIDKHAIVNPRVLVEILSESTRNYDMGRKFEFYQSLESLSEYMIVDQTEAKIIQYARQKDGSWQYRLVVGMEASVSLGSIGCDVPLKLIYRNVEFEPKTMATASPDLPVRLGTPQ